MPTPGQMAAQGATIPAELLAGNSYEDKLMVVRYVAEQEQNRVANAIRSMIKTGL